MDRRKFVAVLFAPVAGLAAGSSVALANPDLCPYNVTISVGPEYADIAELQRWFDFIRNSQLDLLALAPMGPFSYRPES